MVGRKPRYTWVLMCLIGLCITGLVFSGPTLAGSKKTD